MAAQDYSNITIIYNPNSTGGRAEAKAKRLQRHLIRHAANVHLVQTEYAGHAEKIAYTLAKRYKRPLIISSSGDGGYNEVINGVMRARDEDKAREPVCAVLPAGNANDHRRATRKRPLAYAILRNEPEAVDVLRLQVSSPTTSLTRYAHSYIGLGITSKIAIELNNTHLNPWNELQIVWRNWLHSEPFAIRPKEEPARTLDSLVFANISQMAKVLKLGGRTNLHDGLFRVVAIPHRNPFRQLVTYTSIAIRGFKSPPQTATYEFTLPRTQLAHTDGEVLKIPGGSRVRVKGLKEVLLTIR